MNIIILSLSFYIREHLAHCMFLLFSTVFLIVEVTSSIESARVNVRVCRQSSSVPGICLLELKLYFELGVEDVCAFVLQQMSMIEISPVGL